MLYPFGTLGISMAYTANRLDMCQRCATDCPATRPGGPGRGETRLERYAYTLTHFSDKTEPGVGGAITAPHTPHM
jgi:hypothetical protein